MKKERISRLREFRNYRIWTLICTRILKIQRVKDKCLNSWPRSPITMSLLSRILGKNNVVLFRTLKKTKWELKGKIIEIEVLTAFLIGIIQALHLRVVTVRHVKKNVLVALVRCNLKENLAFLVAEISIQEQSLALNPKVG